MTRISSEPRVSSRILLHKLSGTSMLSVVINSHGLEVNAYGFDVSAPTGHESMTLPIISVRYNTTGRVSVLTRTRDVIISGNTLIHAGKRSIACLNA